MILKNIYLDNAASTLIYDEAYEEMLPLLKEPFNPSSIYSASQNAKNAAACAKRRIASLIKCSDREIYFTSGGTESNNWALISAAETLRQKGKHIITQKTEHHSVINTCKYLEQNGCDVTYLDVDSKGVVRIKDLLDSIRDDTILISIMTANNEIGSIQPLKEIGKIAKEKGILFHTDAVSACGHIPIDVSEMNIDMLSASAHKFGGAKGSGFLFIRHGTELMPLIHGGGQQRGKRAGTENVPGIAAMGKAAEISLERMIEHINYETNLRDHLIKRVITEIPDVILNGDTDNRLPGNISFCFKNADGESILILLDRLGICVSSGSACSSGAGVVSHVLKATGVSDEDAHGALRITLSHNNTIDEIDYFADELKKILKRLRGND